MQRELDRLLGKCDKSLQVRVLKRGLKQGGPHSRAGP